MGKKKKKRIKKKLKPYQEAQIKRRKEKER